MAGTSAAKIDPSTATTRTEEPLVSPTSVTTRTEEPLVSPTSATAEMAGTFAAAEMAGTSAAEIDPSTATTKTEEPLASPTSAAAKMAGTSAAEIDPSTATTKMEEPLVSPTSAAAEMAGTSTAEIDPSTSSVTTATNIEELLPSTFSFAAVATAEMEEPLLRNERNVPSSSSGSIIKKSLLIFLFFSIYMFVGMLFYCINSQDFSDVQSNCIIDGLYFSIITFHTMGYGDIVPITPATKVFYCIFILIAVGPVNIIISDAIDYIVDIILDYIVDLIVGADMELMKMYVKVVCAIGILYFYIGLGVLALHIMEDLDWMNSVYLSVISMTTIGYGDMFFKTMTGRMFAFFWLLLMPIATKLILFLGNAFIDMCRWITNRVLI